MQQHDDVKRILEEQVTKISTERNQLQNMLKANDQTAEGEGKDDQNEDEDDEDEDAHVRRNGAMIFGMAALSASALSYAFWSKNA